MEEYAIGNPHQIETCSHYAPMRQIHAAIEHWQRGGFECAIALASAAAEMLPDVDEPHFQELQNISRVNEISNWLIRGASRERLKSGQIDRVVIDELDAILAIYRAILEFEAVFGRTRPRR